jgi:hypothetical protein
VRSRWGRLWLATLGACGRLGFDAATDASGPLPDGAPPASRCSSTAALLCDGFEGALDPRWADDTSHGTATRDPGRAYRGGASLHVRITPIATMETNPRGSLVTYDALPISGTLYVRAWMYFPVPLSPRFTQLINFADDPGDGISLGVEDGRMVTNDYTEPTYAQSATVEFPIGRWTCIQFEMPSGTADSVRELVDGNLVADVTVAKASPQPAPTHLYLGVELVGAVSSYPGIEAWIDELIVDDQPTTCDE